MTDAAPNKPPKEPRRRRRLALRLAAVAAGLLMLAAVAAFLALQSQSVRQALLARISGTVETASGVHFTADDFSLALHRGAVELRGVEVAVSGERPFLEIADLRAEVRLLSFLTSRWIVRSVEIDSPRFDLGASLPQSSGESSEPSARTVEVQRFEITGGAVDSAPESLADDSWLESWRIEGIELRGSYEPQELTVDFVRATLEALRREAVAEETDRQISIDIDGRLHGAPAGPYEIETLTAAGDGLDLSASGLLGFAEDAPLQVKFDLAADPGRWITGQSATGGRVEGDGELDLRLWSGTARWQAHEVPAKLVEPWLGRDALERMGAADSHLNVDADVVLDPEAAEEIAVDADLAWRRGDSLLGEVRADVRGLRIAGESGVELAGEVRVTGTDWHAELLEGWLDADTFGRAGAAGTRFDFDARLDLADGEEDGRGLANVRWRRGTEELVKLDATATIPRSSDRAQGTFIAALLPEHSGRRRLEAELLATDWQRLDAAEITDGTVELEAPDLRAAIEELRQIWPRMVPEIDPQWPVDGSLSLTADLGGTVQDPEVGAEATWQRQETILTIDADGEPLALRGQARLTVADLDLVNVRELAGAPDLAGRLDATVEVAGSPAEWTGALQLDAAGLSSGPDLPVIDELAIEAESDGTELRLTRFSARGGEQTLSGNGAAAVAWPPERADLRFEIIQPVTGVNRVLLDAHLQDGVLELKAPEIDAGETRGELAATMPLATLRKSLAESAPDVEATLASWPAAEGDVTLSFAFPDLDFVTLLAGLDVPLPETLRASTTGTLTLDLADVTASHGTVELPRLEVASDELRLEAGEPVRLALAERRLESAAPRLKIGGRELEVTAAVDLSAGWSPGDAVATLANHLEVAVRGAVEAELLNPYLGGVVASGPLAIEVDLSGHPERLGGQAKLSGPEARLVTRTPYFTRVEQPEAEFELQDGEVFLTLGKLRLNQGEVELTGYRERDGEIELYADLENVRYRLDYGLGTALSAELALNVPAETAPPSERGRLNGRVIVDRGVLRRNLNFEREIVGQLLTPVVATAPDPDDPLAAIDLDLDVVTVDGVRVKNNLADVHTTWSPLTVRGTMSAPWINGRLDIQPGGFVYVLGQTARIDQATVLLNGFPETPPEIEIDMTTSLEDPSVAREGFDRFSSFAAPQPARTTEEIDASREQLLTAGVASYYADQLAGRFLGQVLGGTRIEIAPLLVFGETDPGARLTVSRDLSSHIAFAVSVDLNTENRQTYLLDLHDFRPVPSLSVQLFTNDERNQGVTLQQTFDFGGEEDETRPQIHEVRIEAPSDFELRGVRAAADLGKGDRLPEGAEFDVEVDVAEHLSQQGYPGAEVAVRIEPASKDRVDLVVTLTPGPEVSYDFRGDSLPRAARRTIRRLYRTDVFEQASIEDIQEEAMQALRGLGHRQPEVEVTTEPLNPSDPAGDRTLVVEANAGERHPIEELELRGLPTEVASEVAAGFVSQADRIDLASANEDSDRRLLGMLRRRGYPEPELAGRRLEDEGETLIVELAPGRRLRIAEVRIKGLNDGLAEEEARLLDLLPLKDGDPARSDLVVRGTLTLENDLRGRGYLDARAQAVTSASSPDGEDSLVLTYRLEPGPQYRVDGIRFDGAEATRERWAERVTELEKGEPVAPEDVGDARRRLFDTGLFRSVVPDTERGAGGDATVVFALRERPRFQFSYGLRWESSEGGGAVVDLVDRNAFGRGVTLGFRALWSSDETSGRVYSAFPKVFGTRATVELFLERGEIRESGRFVDRTESTFQVSYPLGEATTTRGYLRYRDSRFLEPDTSDIFTRVRDPILGWQLVHDTRNDKIDASRGHFASVDLTGATSFLGADSRFLRFFGKFSSFRPITRWKEGPVVWAQSLRLGWAEPFDDQVLTPDERFFAGGELSVRGYGNDSLGPVSTTGVPLGGEALLVFNQELRFPVWGSIRGLLFFDAGNVWEDGNGPDFDFFTAAGVGLRVTTPIGLVRFDAAVPLDRRPEDDDVKLYLGLGNVF